MRRILTLLSFLCLLALPAVADSTGRVAKVLPFLLDLQGRHALTPSLYDRDAYQAVLRKHPDQCSALRFDVNWKVGSTTATTLKVRVELRGTVRDKEPFQKTLEQEVKIKPHSRHWTSLTLSGADFKSLGQLTAWRATLWDGDQMVGEQKSFLW
jgi:hypothetical protein